MPGENGQGEELARIDMGEAEPWEPWETKLVAWSIGIGVVCLIVGGFLIEKFILSD